MHVTISTAGPAHEAIHVDFSGRSPASACGAILTLADPDAILAAAAASNGDADWVIWRVDCLPWTEQRAAAFVVALGRQVRGHLFVVLAAGIGRNDRIVGHLRRAGCGREHPPLSLSR